MTLGEVDNQAMAAGLLAVEGGLRKLQKTLRQRPRQHDEANEATLAAEPRASDPTPVSLSAEEFQLFRNVHQALLDDLRFEHLGRKAERAVWGFVRDCLRDKGANQVSVFVAQHSREPMELVCYAPVEYLSVTRETEILGIQLSPLGAPHLPTAGKAFRTAPPVGCVAAVSVRGTSYENMTERARSTVNHALRVLRVALREARGLNDWQFRFRLAGDYSFSDGAWGTSRGPDSAFDLGLNAELV